MNIDYSAYKITLLLYLGVLLLPVSFYFSYSSFDEIKSDTLAINKLTITSGQIVYLSSISNNIDKQKLIVEIDKNLLDLKPWIVQNNENHFYVGSEPLEKKYNQLLSCWSDSKKGQIDKFSLCWSKAQTIIFSLNNMLKLKQNKMYNIFYINLFVAMAILLTLIFLIRIDIHTQLNKHAIYDFKTKLYNKEYLLATLKEISARTKREDIPLNLLYLKVDNIDNNELAKVSKIFLNSVRASDIACRYSQSEFIIILPNTNSKDSTNLQHRVEKQLNDEKYKINLTEHSKNESYENFILRVIG